MESELTMKLNDLSHTIGFARRLPPSSGGPIHPTESCKQVDFVSHLLPQPRVLPSDLRIRQSREPN